MTSVQRADAIEPLPLATQNDDDLAGAVGIVHEQGPGTIQPPAEKTGAEAPVLEPQEPEPARPSRVLLVGIDGLRPDAIKRSKTPYLDALAKRGLLFTNAHAPSPKCAPSRAAILTGRRASTTGLYSNGHWWRPAYPDLVTLPQHFKKHVHPKLSLQSKLILHTACFNFLPGFG